jgi:SOS-response transcriptional repressor LexA
MPKPSPHNRLSPQTNLTREVAVHAMNSLDPKTGAWTPTAIETIEIAESLIRPRLLVVRMEDAGMEPVIRRQAYVGLDRDDVTARNGEIYALDIPGEGLVIKQVEPDGAGRRLRLVSASPRHAERSLAQGGSDYVVIGRVVWVIQDL